jgi:hypothetical protein
MQRALIGLVAGLAVTGVLAAPAAHAESHFSFYFGIPAPVVVAPPVVVQPAPVVVAPPVVYDSFWQPGYYGWVGYQRRWVPGRWVQRAPRAYWNRGWGHDNRGRWDGGRGRYVRDSRRWVRGGR